MKLSIERDALSRALSIVGRLTGSKSALEINEHVLIDARGGSVVLSASDMEIRASTVLPADVEAPFRVTLAASTLAEYVNRLPPGSEIEIGRADHGDRVSLRSGRSRATLGSLDPEVFPWLKSADVVHGFEIEGAAIAGILGDVDFAAWGDADRPMLAGVLLQVVHTDDGLWVRAAAADGKRVGRARSPCGREAEGSPDIIIPKRAVAEIKRIAGPLAGEMVQVRISATEIELQAGPTTLVSKLIESSYPDLDRAIPRNADKAILADAPQFLAALARSAIVADDKYRSSRFRFDAGALEIVSQSSKSGDIVESVDIEYDGPPFDLRLNSKFARDILTALDCDTVRIDVGAPGMPTIWTSPADAHREYVLMPLVG